MSKECSIEKPWYDRGWDDATKEALKAIEQARQDERKKQECCICGKYTECNEVSIGNGVHFKCCSRECLKKLFEYERSLKAEERKKCEKKQGEDRKNWKCTCIKCGKKYTPIAICFDCKGADERDRILRELVKLDTVELKEKAPIVWIKLQQIKERLI